MITHCFLKLLFPHRRPNLHHSLPVVIVAVTAYETQRAPQAPAPSSSYLFPKQDLSPIPFPSLWALSPDLDSSQSAFSSSVYPLGTAQRPWELLSGRLQEHRLYSRKRARVCLSSPQDNISHVENLLWLQLLHSGCACVSSFPPALVGCSNFYCTLKEKATLQLW